MYIKLKIALLPILIFFGVSFAGAQNLFKNGSFELKDPLVWDNKPNDHNQLRKCKYWKREDGISPDWLKADSDLGHIRIQENIGGTFTDVTASSGVSYGGMFSTELMQQKLDNKLKARRHKFKAKIRVTDRSSRYAVNNSQPGHLNVTGGAFILNSPANLYIWLGKDKIKYDFDDAAGCQNGNSDITKKDGNVLVATIPISTATHTPGSWHEVEAEFVVPWFSYDWVGFDTDACTGYVMIDEVSLEEIPCEDCVQTCNVTDECVEFAVLNNPCGQDNPLSIRGLSNVELFRWEIYNAGGSKVRHIEFSNPPHIVSWDGKNDGGQEVAGGYYEYTLTLWNDCEIIHTNRDDDNNVFVKSNASTEPTNFIEATMSYTPVVKQDLNEACCYECIEINANTIDFIYPPNNLSEVGGPAILTGNLTIQAIDQIKVDNNVIFDVNSNITLIAGEEVTIDKDDVIMLPGATVSCLIEECTGFHGNDKPGGVQARETREGEALTEETRLEEDNLEEDFSWELEEVREPVEDPVKVFPNPTSGDFFVTFQFTEATPVQLQMTDLTGKVIFNRQMVAGSDHIQLQLQDLPAGIYVLQVRYNQETFVEKVIKN